MDYMHRIQARSPFTQTFVVLKRRPEGSPLATERGVWGHSASIYCNVRRRAAGSVEATLATLNKLYEER